MNGLGHVRERPVTHRRPQAKATRRCRGNGLRHCPRSGLARQALRPSDLFADGVAQRHGLSLCTVHNHTHTHLRRHAVFVSPAAALRQWASCPSTGAHRPSLVDTPSIPTASILLHIPSHAATSRTLRVDITHPQVPSRAKTKRSQGGVIAQVERVEPRQLLHHHLHPDRVAGHSDDCAEERLQGVQTDDGRQDPASARGDRAGEERGGGGCGEVVGDGRCGEGEGVG